jgi:hypothetical protein
MSDNKINAKDFELKEENKDNFKQSVIERKNVVTEFTVEVVEEHKADLVKFERELESQISLCQKTIDNMLKNHEWLKDMDEEKLHHAWMMKSNADVIAEAEPKLEEVKGQLAQYNDLLDTVYEKFGFVKSEVATPAVEPEDE